ncbi:MAG: phosphate acyltransferase PlsX [Calditrichaeota bacterium]|nr:phosphate acyltransferase PlsX [Candidatus Cloacimonadota bacterium]MCB1047545.1 phosphate acyltransferase PlsX [Calditrichota bacterium]MCB9473331.1 phosphate acyltransferase PlsX [Candidatus Delongbacteria bacterium]
MRLALDAMGGDHAPGVVLEAVRLAVVRWPELSIKLVGLPDQLPDLNLPQVERVACGSVITMDDSPLAALRQKRDSSIAVALDLHRQGVVDAVVSAGSTGAQVAASMKHLGRIDNLRRPAIISVLPTSGGPLVLLDVGASSDAGAADLLQYAWMGHCYANTVHGIKQPKVGLLSIGEEPGKGNRVVVEAHALLRSSGLNFIGNLEGRDILAGKADVLVCDGFTGNVVLKFAESILPLLKSRLGGHIRGHWLRLAGALLLRPAIHELKQEFNYEEYGGAPLVGVNGTSIICHGSSSAAALVSAIGVARSMVDGDLNARIRAELERTVAALAADTARNGTPGDTPAA